MDYKKYLSVRTKKMSGDAIKQLLSAASDPEIISLAGGLPDHETFPVDIIRTLFEEVNEEFGNSLYQYSHTEGLPSLRAAVSLYLRHRDLEVTQDQVFISSGSQTAIDSAAKVLINPGDNVAVEQPTYLAAIKAFRLYEANLLGIECDENGIVPESLEEALTKYRVKLLYLIPNFQNPSGRTLPLNRRQQIADIAQKKDLIIIEDDPYYDLRYRGDHLPTIKSMIPDRVIYTGSLSKVLSPGLRVGFYVAPKDISDQMLSVRQVSDVHASTLSQAIAAKYISGEYIYDHVENACKLYSERLAVMQKSLRESFPSDFSFSDPDGGMFVWVQGPSSFESTKLYPRALEKKVAFVPGNFFFTDQNMGKNTMRLNFTNINSDMIKKAIEVLGNLLD